MASAKVIRAGIGVTATVAALALPMFGPFAKSAAAQNTLSFYEHDTDQTVLDLGNPGPGPGDQLLFAGDLFDRPGGTALGRIGGVCTTVSGDQTAGLSSCTATLNVAGGQVVTGALFDTAAVFGRGEAAPMAITGGTGRYSNARGTGTVQVPPDVPNQADANVVLNVVT